MRIARSELLSALKPLKPALAGERDVIEAQRQIWFDGAYAYAHSRSFGVRSAIKTPFDFGINGKLILELLTKSTVDDVVLERSGTGAVLDLGRSVVNLSIMNKQRRPRFYDEPKGAPLATLTVSRALLRGLQGVLLLKPGKVQRLEHRGVCIFSMSGGIDLYTTDSRMIALAELDLPIALQRAVLLRVFAEQVVKQCTKGGIIEFYEDHVRVQAKNTITLYANVIDPRGMLDLPSYADRYCDPKLAPPFRIPAGFGAVLEHAMTLAGRDDEPVVTLRTLGHSLAVSGKFNGSVINEEFKVDRDLPSRRISILLAKPLNKIAMMPDPSWLMVGADSVAWRNDNLFFLLPSH